MVECCQLQPSRKIPSGAETNRDRPDSSFLCVGEMKYSLSSVWHLTSLMRGKKSDTHTEEEKLPTESVQDPRGVSE
ncbi:DNA-binding helix-turn-helix protein [Anopheles sinensis]|uniref:DNA-binding helix-turn-helix protein n=1 Tax=Anopheles sinensis TaxID=74873 RepID=A0A084VCR4_ANOSI|nr:DNA-binding helix-turn-helix protein [Anopheles sinensis]